MASLSFRNSRVIYYGPHPCENCGETICKAGNEFGSSAFTYPDTPIYPNTEWNPHFCNPQDVRDQRGKEARVEVIKSFPLAVPIKWGDGFVISGNGVDQNLLISCNLTCYDTQWAAWSGALYRAENGYPTWSLDK